MSATELARAIRERRLSAAELLEATIARIEARDPSLNAFVYRAFDESRARAREADAAVASGRAARAAARRPDRDQGPVRLQARLAGHVRRHPRAARHR